MLGIMQNVSKYAIIQTDIETFLYVHVQNRILALIPT